MFIFKGENFLSKAHLLFTSSVIDNVCVPPKFHLLKLYPQYDCIWNWAFGRQFGSDKVMSVRPS